MSAWKEDRAPRRERLSTPPLNPGDFVCLAQDTNGEAGVVEDVARERASVRWARGSLVTVEVARLRRVEEPPPVLWAVLDVGASRRVEDGLEVWGLGETIAAAMADACASDDYVMTVHERVVPISLRDVGVRRRPR